MFKIPNFALRNKLDSLLIGIICFFLYLRKPDDSFSNEFEINYLVDLLRSRSLLICIFCLALFCLIQFFKGKRTSPERILWPFLCSKLFYSIRIFGLQDLIYSSANILVVAFFIFISTTYKNPIKHYQLSSNFKFGLYFFFLLFLFSSVYLLLIDKGFMGYRFIGLSYHPNQYGLVAALAFVYFMNLTLKENVSLYVRLFHISLSVGSIFFLFLSASRGATLAALVGTTLHILKKKFSIYNILIILLIIFLFLKISFISEFQNQIFDRFIDNIDSRTDPFLEMWQVFKSSPLIGVGLADIASENSYLKSLALGGITCGMPLIIFGTVIPYFVIRIFMLGLKNPTITDNSHLETIIVIWTASFFDGYLFEKFSLSSFILIFSIVTLTVKNQFNRPSDKTNKEYH